MMMQANWRYHALTQGIKAIKTLTEYKKYYRWSFYHKKTQEALSNVEIAVTK